MRSCPCHVNGVINTGDTFLTGVFLSSAGQRLWICPGSATVSTLCLFFFFLLFADIDATFLPFLSPDKPEFPTGSAGSNPKGLLYLQLYFSHHLLCFPPPCLFHLSLGLRPPVSRKGGRNVSRPFALSCACFRCKLPGNRSFPWERDSILNSCSCPEEGQGSCAVAPRSRTTNWTVATVIRVKVGF